MGRSKLNASNNYIKPRLVAGFFICKGDYGYRGSAREDRSVEKG
jgi:hypothetical protein